MKISIIFSNIIGFDGIIFIVALINLGVFFIAKNSINKLYNTMHKQVYAPSCKNDIQNIKSDMEALTDNKVSRIRERAVGRYTLYINITSIFPLLGILGTVIALLGMVGSSSNLNNGFFSALTSTFWGLVFAIFFKFMDGFLSPKLDDGERSAELFMQRQNDINTDKFDGFISDDNVETEISELLNLVGKGDGN